MAKKKSLPVKKLPERLAEFKGEGLLRPRIGTSLAIDIAASATHKGKISGLNLLFELATILFNNIPEGSPAAAFRLLSSRREDLRQAIEDAETEIRYLWRVRDHGDSLVRDLKAALKLIASRKRKMKAAHKK